MARSTRRRSRRNQRRLTGRRQTGGQDPKIGRLQSIRPSEWNNIETPWMITAGGGGKKQTRRRRRTGGSQISEPGLNLGKRQNGDMQVYGMGGLIAKEGGKKRTRRRRSGRRQSGGFVADYQNDAGHSAGSEAGIRKFSLESRLTEGLLNGGTGGEPEGEQVGDGSYSKFRTGVHAASDFYRGRPFPERTGISLKGGGKSSAKKRTKCSKQRGGYVSGTGYH